MSYVIGLSYQKTNIIICDSRVTVFDNNNPTGDNYHLKLVRLFENSFLGYVGNVEKATQFIKMVQKVVQNERFNLEQIIQFMDDNKNPCQNELEHFELLISTCSSEPKFFIMNSKTGISKPEMNNGLVTLGSGKGCLDNFIHESLTSKRNYLECEMNKNKDIPEEEKPEILAHMYCAALLEKAFASEKTILDKYGVGGYFYFWFQNSSGIFSQRPHFLMLCDTVVNHGKVILWNYRLLFVNSVLYIEQYIPPNQYEMYPKGTIIREAIVNEINLPQNCTIDCTNLNKLILDEAQIPPFYYFFSVGFTKEEERKQLIYRITTDSGLRDEILTPDNLPTAKISNWIKTAIIESHWKQSHQDDKPTNAYEN